MANVIATTNRPTLVLAPNKTLAAQLYGEMKGFFPENAVEYFVSYYDYYQPEAYVPRTDTFIEKDSSINEQIDRMRHSATRALMERDDVIIVASVSCIYGIGPLENYQAMTFRLNKGQKADRAHADPQARRAAIQAQRQRLPARHLPGARRHARPVPGPLRGQGLALRDVRRRDRIDHRVRSADRREDRDAVRHHRLRQQPLRDAAADDAEGDRPDKDRPQAAARRVQSRRPPARGAAARAAHDVRHRDAGNDGRLRRHRELFALPHRPQAGRAAAYPVRILPRELAADRRREPRHGAADRRHVPRRLQPQERAGRVRLPPAVGDRQPAAEVRGVGHAASADDLRQRHARSVGDGAHARRLHRAGHSPHRPDRSDGDHPPGREAGRRPDRRVQGLREEGASACWSPC